MIVVFRDGVNVVYVQYFLCLALCCCSSCLVVTPDVTATQSDLLHFLFCSSRRSFRVGCRRSSSRLDVIVVLWPPDAEPKWPPSVQRGSGVTTAVAPRGVPASTNEVFPASPTYREEDKIQELGSWPSSVIHQRNRALSRM